MMYNTRLTLNRRSVGELLAATAMLFCLLLAGNDLHGQTWHYEYGPSNADQYGAKKVRPVEGTCSGSGGYIAVGTTYYPNNSPAPDVYVVRTTNTGAKLWEYTYDVQSNGSNDRGNSIIELSNGSGFIVVGSTETYDPVESLYNTDAFMMKIDCSGNVVWTRTYQGPTVGSVFRYSNAQDIVEATTGNGTTTNAGDLLVAGSVLVNNSDALLFRTTSTGTLIWNANYDNTGSPRENEFLMGLIEATPLNIGSYTTGDIVAVGMHISSTNPSGNNYNGLILRVSGTDGSISYGGPLKQGIATYGFGTMMLPTNDIFLSLIELQNPSETGSSGLPNVAVVGFGVNHVNGQPVGGVSNYLVKLDNGNPCTPLIEAFLGYSNAQDEGHDIKEIPYQINSTPEAPSPLQQWDLVISGRTNGGAAAGTLTADLFAVDPTTFAPIASGGMMYRPATEALSSLDIVDATHGKTQGVIRCGSSNSGDKDLYLIKTDLALSAGDCEDPYEPTKWTNTTKVCLGAVTDDYIEDISATAVKTSRKWGTRVCFSLIATKEVPLLSDNSLPIPNSSYGVNAAPNPISTSDNLTLRFTGSNIPQTAQITVTNALGEVMQKNASTQINPDGTVSITTNGWSTGVYFVNVNDGSFSRTMRVVLVE